MQQMKPIQDPTPAPSKKPAPWPADLSPYTSPFGNAMGSQYTLFDDGTPGLMENRAEIDERTGKPAGMVTRELGPIELEYLRAQIEGADEKTLKAIQDRYYQQYDLKD